MSSVHRDGFGLGSDRTLADFEKLCGVSVPNNVEAIARIGCCNVASVEEKLAKYGRIEAYELLLHEFDNKN